MKLVIGFVVYSEASAKYLSYFLPSLFDALSFLDLADYRVYAFDNSLIDDKVNRIFLENFNKLNPIKNKDNRALVQKIHYLSQGVNLGFSRAYNILIDSAITDQADYFLMINPDILLESDSIKNLLYKLNSDNSLGSVAPKIKRWDFINNIKTNIIDSAGLVLLPGLKFIDLGQSLIDEGQFDNSPILGPSGAAGLFRISALKKSAEMPCDSGKFEYLDESFFMYKEDCDLAYRLSLKGYKSALVSKSVVYHDRTATASGRGFWGMLLDRSSKSQQVRAWSFRNQHLIYKKHWKSQSFVNACLIVLRSLAMLIFSLIIEQFLLKEYFFVYFKSQRLTNIK